MRTVEPPLIPEESDLTLRVASDQAQDDRLLLAPLKSIYTSQLDTREEILQGCEERKLFVAISLQPMISALAMTEETMVIK